jgi:hypothetical protein
VSIASEQVTKSGTRGSISAEGVPEDCKVVWYGLGSRRCVGYRQATGEIEAGRTAITGVPLTWVPAHGIGPQKAGTKPSRQPRAAELSNSPADWQHLQGSDV